MISITPNTRCLSALSGVLLVTVSLAAISLPVMAKEKTKSKPAAETSEMVDVSYSVSIPTIDTVDANVEDDVLVDILSGDIVANAEALAALDATSITVPEIEVTVTGDQDGVSQTATIMFSNLVLENVADGVAGSVTLSGAEVGSEEGSFSIGALSAAQLDIGGLLGIYGLVDAGGQTELQTIYTDFLAEGGTLESPEVDCTIGPVSGAEFKARPLRTSFADMIALVERLEDDPENVDPALYGPLMRMYADLFTAFETSEVSFGGMSCKGVDDEEQAISFSVAGMTVGAMTPGIYPGISMDGFDIAVEDDGTMSLENFTMKPIDLTGVIATLESAPDTIDDAWLEANMRGLVPAIEGFSMSGFSMDIPDPETKGGRIAAALGSFDLSLGSYRNGIPTDTEVSATNIKAELPQGTGDETVEQLRALGVTDIDAGFRIAASWNEGTSSIDIEEVSVTGVDLATVTLAATIANATEDLFSLDENVSLASAMGLTVKSLDASVVDEGLADIALAAVAADQGADAATLRPIYADLAKGTVISLLAGVADAAKLGDAVSAFIAGTAKTLEIGIDAKAEEGLGMLDFMAAETDPTALLSKVNISAEAK